MALMHFLKPKNNLEEGGRSKAQVQKVQDPERKCPNCRKMIPLTTLWANELVCDCGYHFRMKARQRIRMIVDKGSFQELFSEVISDDPLRFPGYTEKIEAAREASGEKEAVITGTADLMGQPVCIFAMEPYFMMGSMGTAVGEKITALFEYALKKRLPVLGFTVSGGARMQEGLLSLMQMAKTSAAVKRHSDAGFLYIAVLTDPTTGGVTASFAMEADLILSEPNTLIGFAGARVIEQTTKKALPQGFQKAEFVLDHGFVDMIVERPKQKETIGRILKLHSLHNLQ